MIFSCTMRLSMKCSMNGLSVAVDWTSSPIGELGCPISFYCASSVTPRYVQHVCQWSRWLSYGEVVPLPRWIVSSLGDQDLCRSCSENWCKILKCQKLWLDFVLHCSFVLLSFFVICHWILWLIGVWSVDVWKWADLTLLMMKDFHGSRLVFWVRKTML